MTLGRKPRRTASVSRPRRLDAAGVPTVETPRPPAPRLVALRLLGRRDLTAAEVSARLIERGYAPDDVAREVERLVAERAIDDQRTAVAHADMAIRVKGRGRLRIRRELEARGLSRAVVDAALAHVAPAADELAAIRRVLARRRVHAHSSPADRRRAVQHLLRRGFPAEAIRQALRWEDE